MNEEETLSGNCDNTGCVDLFNRIQAVGDCLGDLLNSIYRDYLTAEDFDWMIGLFRQKGFPDKIMIMDEDGRLFKVFKSPQLDEVVNGLDGDWLHEFFGAREVASCLDVIRRTVLTGRRQNLDYRVGDGGAPEWFTAYVFPLNATHAGRKLILWIARYITPRVDAESQLRAVELAFTQIMKHSPVGMGVCGPDDAILAVNPALCRLLGYSENEMRRMTYREITHPDDVALQAPLMARIYQGTLENFQMEKRYRRKDGRAVCTRLSVAAVPSEDGAIGCSVYICEDVTLHKLAERERCELENQRLRSARMEAVGTLAAGVAHDFNNMLGSIMLNLGLISEAAGGGTNIAQYAEQALAVCGRGRAMTRQILAFGRREGSCRQPLEVVRHVSDTLKLVRAGAPAGIEIVSRLVPAESIVWIDPTQLDQVLINLCSNALQAMPDGRGHLTVSLEEQEIDQAAASQLGILPGAYLCLGVSDTGCGMSAEIRAHVFEPFFTTRRAGEGSGMGLAIVHGIVTDCGGAVAVDSQEDRGTHVSVLLPCRGAPQTGDASADVVAPHGDETVLLVDDEPAVLENASAILRHAGYAVVALKSAPEALRWFEENPLAADIVVTDFFMPGMLGTDLAQRIKLGRADLPVLMITGYSDKVGDICRCGRYDVDGVLAKPFTAEELCRSLRTVLDGVGLKRNKNENNEGADC